MFRMKIWYRLFVNVLLVYCYFRPGLTTEVTEASRLVYNISAFNGQRIEIPVLMCHAKYTGYKKVFWYKDFKLVKNGSAELSDHTLSLSSLLDNSSINEFSNPLKLQGYYWCETDYVTHSPKFKYLYRIKNIHTFVGKLIATQDSLSTDNSFSFQEKLTMKKAIYESEMQDLLFGFIPKPNTFVTNIEVKNSSLKVHFYLYVRHNLIPRKPHESELVEDQHELDYVEDYLNDATVTEVKLHKEISEWITFRGIDPDDIDLKSTLGCYTHTSLTLTDPPREINWPYAEIGSIVIPEEACSAESGLAVTKTCLGSFTSGAKWSVQDGKCNVAPNDLTQDINALYDKFGDEVVPKYVEKLKNLLENPKLFTVTDIHITINILKKLSKVPKLTNKDMNNIFEIVDNLLQVNSSILDASKSTLRLTNRMLQVFDNMMGLAGEEKVEIQTSQKHILVDTKFTKINNEQHVIGVAILNPLAKTSLENGSIEFILNKTMLPIDKSIAYFWLPKDLIIKRENDLLFPCQLNMVYFKEWFMFPNPKGVLVKRNYRVLPTPVLYVSLSGGPAWNLTDPVQIFFKNNLKKKIENPMCVYYDPRLDNGKGDWSTEGCSYSGLKDGFYSCHCHHLSIFAVILSERPGYRASMFNLSISVYVACGFSIIALSVAVLMHILSKIWRSTVDHSILFWLSLCFLTCVILLFISEMHFRWKPGCLALAMIFHYQVLVMFCWLFIYSVLHQLRFSKKTDVAEIPGFIIRCWLGAFIVPAFIMIIIWLSKKYNYYDQDTCWPTVAEVSEYAFIPNIIILLLTFCMNFCAGYAVTCRFKKDFLIGENKYNEDYIKFRVAVSIYFVFVLTWIFGYLALHYKSKEFQILFSISMTITAFYVTLFFIFQEISLWDLCGKCKKKTRTGSHEILKYNAKLADEQEKIDD